MLHQYTKSLHFVACSLELMLRVKEVYYDQKYIFLTFQHAWGTSGNCTRDSEEQPCRPHCVSWTSGNVVLVCSFLLCIYTSLILAYVLWPHSSCWHWSWGEGTKSTKCKEADFLLFIKCESCPFLKAYRDWRKAMGQGMGEGWVFLHEMGREWDVLDGWLIYFKIFTSCLLTYVVSYGG